MRSLFTDDIPGARPVNRCHLKSIHRHKHEEEVEKFGIVNPEQKRTMKSMDWHKPLPKHVQPLQNPKFDMKPTLKAQSPIKPKAIQSPYSLKDYYEVTGKVNQESPKLHKSSILSDSGLKTMKREGFQLDDNPYFPHMYRDNDKEYPNKWTGQRGWNQSSMELMQLPKAKGKGHYFPKWG